MFVLSLFLIRSSSEVPSRRRPRSLIINLKHEEAPLPVLVPEGLAVKQDS
jgi:hypothetical protein